MASMVEYIIEIVEGGEVAALIHTERDGSLTRTKPSFDGYSHCKKYRIKERAEKVASKILNAVVSPTYGGYQYGTKRTVAPKQSKINRHSAYKSI